MELAEADRYPPQIPWNLHGGVVRLVGSPARPGSTPLGLVRLSRDMSDKDSLRCSDWLMSHVMVGSLRRAMRTLPWENCGSGGRIPRYVGERRIQSATLISASLRRRRLPML